MATNEQRIEEAHKVVEAFGDLRLSMHHVGEVIVSGIASGFVVDNRPPWLRWLDRTLAKWEKAQGWR